MFKKLSKCLCVLVVSCCMSIINVLPVSAFDNIPQIRGVQLHKDAPIADKKVPDIRTNYARMHGVRATASSEEEYGSPIVKRSADLAIDGIIDNDHRWASQNNADKNPLPEESLMIDLQKEQSVKEIVLHWQRKNIIHFKVEGKGETGDYEKLYESTARLTNDTLVTTIDLSTNKSLRYVRISSDHYDGATANADSGGYTAVSLLEVGIYDKAYKENMEEISDTASALRYVENNSTTAGSIPRDESMLSFVKVPGYTVEVCADYEQLIDHKGNVYHPLTNQTVKYLYKVSDDFGKSESKEYSIQVAGLYDTAGVNAKLKVIPELAQWYGGEGFFTMGNASRIVYKEASLKTAMEEFQKDLKAITGIRLPLIQGSNAQANDFYFAFDKDVANLGKEGYEMDIQDILQVKATTETGAYYATRSILQILQQVQESDAKLTIPKGMTKDYPKYQIRGFMLDVARKPIAFDTVKQISKAMAWYKLNDFQIHLNDNYAKMEKHLKNPASTDIKEIEGLMDTVLSAFRLESNESGLTSKDVSYSKQEFGQFIDDSKNIGLQVVPEFDVPGHSLAFLKNHKNLYYKGAIESDPWGSVAPSADRIAMFDLDNPDAIAYIKHLFDEYIDDGTFRDSVVHVGADEYYGSKESYRKYVDDILRYISETKHRTPRIWGSLSAKKGTSPVYNKNVQMNIWNTDWANPTDMLKQGYQLINTNDCELYIVPGGNWYHDYLDSQYIYNTFEPNRFVSGASSYDLVATIPAGNEQMIGSAFALWNDGVDLSSNGINEYEINQRILKALPAVSAKMWGDGGDGLDLSWDAFQTLSNSVASHIPETNLLSEVKTTSDKVVGYDFKGDTMKDTSGNGYDGKSLQNAKIANGHLTLHGGSSYLETGLQNLGPINHLQMTVKRSSQSEDNEQILMESDQGSVKAIQKGTGKVGYSREGYDYSFNYTLPKDEWVKLDITCDEQAVKLFVNGECKDTLNIMQTRTTGKDPFKTNQAIHQVTPTRYLDYPTLVLPLSRIGSKTNAFTGDIKDFKVFNKTVSDVEYKQLLVTIGKMKETDYTKDSWQVLQKAMADNVIVMNDTMTQNAIDIAIENINKAVQALEKVKSSNSYLTSIEGITLQQSFDKDVTDYTAVVENDVTNIVIQAYTEDENATVQIMGAENLQVGKNIITITVHAEDQSTRIYTITVTRKGLPLSANADLASIQGIALEQTFDKDCLEYTAVVPFEITSLDIKALAEDAFAKVEIIGADKLHVGVNTIMITVTAEDGTKKVYTIQVTRIKEVSTDVDSVKNLIQTLPVIISKHDANKIIESDKSFANLSNQDKAKISQELIDKLQSAKEQLGILNHISNNVTIHGLPWYVEVIASPLTSKDMENKYNFKAVVEAYDIILFDTYNYKEYQPKQDVKVSIQLKDTKPNDTLYLYHVMKGVVQRVDGSIKENTLMFKIKSFSPFVITRKPVYEHDAALQGKTNGKNDVDTGDTTQATLWLLLLIGTMLGAGIIVVKKRKCKE